MPKYRVIVECRNEGGTDILREKAIKEVFGNG